MYYGWIAASFFSSSPWFHPAMIIKDPNYRLKAVFALQQLLKCDLNARQQLSHLTKGRYKLYKDRHGVEIFAEALQSRECLNRNVVPSWPHSPTFLIW